MFASLALSGAPARFTRTLAAIAASAVLALAAAPASAQPASAAQRADSVVALAALIQASDAIAFTPNSQSIGMALPPDMAFELARAYRDEGFQAVEDAEHPGFLCLGRDGRCAGATGVQTGDGAGVAEGVLVPSVNFAQAYRVAASIALGDPSLVSTLSESPRNEFSRVDHGARGDEKARADAIDTFLAASDGSADSVETTGNDDLRFDGPADVNVSRGGIAQRYAKLGGRVVDAEFAPGRLTLAFPGHGCATEGMGASAQAAANGVIEPTARCVSVSQRAYEQELAAGRSR